MLPFIDQDWIFDFGRDDSRWEGQRRAERWNGILGKSKITPAAISGGALTGTTSNSSDRRCATTFAFRANHRLSESY